MRHPERHVNEEPAESGERKEADQPAGERFDMEGRKEDMAERDAAVEHEKTKETLVAKGKVAETVWRRPASFVSDMVNDTIAPMLKRFFERFGALGDDAVPEGEMRDARDAARDAAERD